MELSSLMTKALVFAKVTGLSPVGTKLLSEGSWTKKSTKSMGESLIAILLAKKRALQRRLKI